MGLAHPMLAGGNVVTSPAKPIPEGYHTITPVLMVNDEADRFPEAGLRRPGKGTLHGSDREDRPRGGHARGLDRPVERRDRRVEAGPSAAAPVRDGHRLDVPTGPKSRCDIPAGADGRVLRRPDRGRQ